MSRTAAALLRLSLTSVKLGNLPLQVFDLHHNVCRSIMSLPHLLLLQDTEPTLLRRDDALACRLAADLWCIHRTLLRNRRRLHRLQILEEPRKGGLEGVVVFPVCEIGDKVFAHLDGQILTGVGVEAFPLAEGVKIHEADREEF